MNSNSPTLLCPDCLNAGHRSPLSELRCPRCGRVVTGREGILDLLPGQIEAAAAKQREQEGWAALGAHDLDSVRGFYLQLPYVAGDDPGLRHYRQAADEYDAVVRLVQPRAGMQGLDLGGSIGWAARRFAEQGAAMTVADFNDHPVSGLGGARVYVEAGIPLARHRVDAECLPYADDQFDFIFCCAFLHHLNRPERALQHIARTLKPGGWFAAITESFCPWWMTRAQALRRSDQALHFIEHGVQEQVFHAREYARWFRGAGLEYHVLNLRWDTIQAGNWQPNQRLQEPDFRPEILQRRAQRNGLAGATARALLATGAWRVAAWPPFFRMARPLLLASTQKQRILLGRKPR